MIRESLYHFFPRKEIGVEETVNILESFFKNGIYLSKEIIDIGWKDLFAKRSERKLKINQYRFCLTAISNRTELMDHSNRFGYVGLEFNLNTIVNIGGFPVFYVPSPIFENCNKDEYKGISLLYRLAEIQELLEFFKDLENKNAIVNKDIDIENTIGAIKLLANICYPTHRLTNNDKKITSYYQQREWRIIYGLTSSSVMTKSKEDQYAIFSYNGKNICNYISKITIVCNHHLSEEGANYLITNFERLQGNYNFNIPIEIIHN